MWPTRMLTHFEHMKTISNFTLCVCVYTHIQKKELVFFVKKKIWKAK